MEKKKIVDLIKLEVLSCLSDKDRDNLQSLKTEGSEFPWKTLGDYQNLIAFLPLVLELKYPANDLKDRTAMKLYSIRDQIKAKIDAKKALENPVQPEVEFSESIVNTEEVVMTEQIEVEESVLAEVEEGVQFSNVNSATGKDDAFRFVSKFKEKSEQEELIRQTAEIVAREAPKAVIDKELVEKIARDFLKSHLERELESIRKTVGKNKILTFILFIVSVILIIAAYFIN